MKNFLFATLILLVVFTAGAQPKPKPKEKEKVPTQKEMQDMMKEAQKELDNMSPEDKKMMDSMGIKMPDMKSLQKSVSGISDAQLKKAYEDESRIVPQKDAARINSISKTPLTAATLPAFLQQAHVSVIGQLKPASQKKGEEIYAVIRADKNKGSTAASLWMLGKAELALYVMGKACTDEPQNTDNINNYASMLSMSGAEQLAIPLLDNLNKQYPGNSTILNNLGQAWFGLGDIASAEKYLDAALLLYPWHPQANYTKSFIEESRGNQAAAVACIRKSLKHAYTEEKEDRLRKMGEKMDTKDIRLPFKPSPDPLNLSSFRHPDFPSNVDECIVLEKAWATFKENCATEVAKLNTQLKQAMETLQQSANQRLQQSINIVKTSQAKGYITGNLTVVPFFAPKALVKLNALLDAKDGYEFQLSKSMKAITDHMLTRQFLEKNYNEQIAILNEQDLEQTGEGKPNADFCPKKKAVADTYIAAYNNGLQQKWDTYLDITKRHLNETVYWYQYIQWPEEFEVTKLKAKISWLSTISDAGYVSITAYKCAPVKSNKQGGKLSEFDDVHCVYHSELKLGAGTIKTDCSRMTTELDLKFVKLGLKQDMNKETFNDQFMSCSVEVGVSAGAGIKGGPLKAEASVGAAVGAEFDRNGLKDVVVKVNAGISAGTDMIEGGSVAGMGVNDLSAEVGVQGQVSLISGKSSVESTGLLQGVFKK